MIKAGFVSAILPEADLEDILSFAAENSYSCVEVMCWPVGKAERRYAGITHIDVSDLSGKKIDNLQISRRKQESKFRVWAITQIPWIPMMERLPSTRTI